MYVWINHLSSCLSNWGRTIYGTIRMIQLSERTANRNDSLFIYSFFWKEHLMKWWRWHVTTRLQKKQQTGVSCWIHWWIHSKNLILFWLSGFFNIILTDISLLGLFTTSYKKSLSVPGYDMCNSKIQVLILAFLVGRL